MTRQGPPLPPGYSEIRLRRTDSTNAEAWRRARDGAEGGLWIRAEVQEAGRGRSGRRWESPEGNLYASLLLRPACAPQTVLQLSFVAGLAAFDAVAALGETLRGHLALKWPNDLLLDGAKLGGVLLESLNGAGGTPAVVIGTGLNLAGHPPDTATPATHLAAHGVDASPDEAFHRLARATAQWLDEWADGAGWEAVRSAWLERGPPIGAPISVRLADGEITGRYAGIDGQGALVLKNGDEGEKRITAGDVFLL